MYMDHDNDKRDRHVQSIDRSIVVHGNTCLHPTIWSPSNAVVRPQFVRPPGPSQVHHQTSFFVLFLCLFTTLALWLLFCVWMLCVNKYVCVDRQKCFDILPTVLSCIVLPVLYLQPTMVSPRSVLLLERRAPPVRSVAWRRVVRLVDSFRSLIVVHVYPTK